MIDLYTTWNDPVRSNPFYPVIYVITLEAIYQLRLWGPIVMRDHHRIFTTRKQLDKIKRVSQIYGGGAELEHDISRRLLSPYQWMFGDDGGQAFQREYMATPPPKEPEYKEQYRPKMEHRKIGPNDVVRFEVNPKETK